MDEVQTQECYSTSPVITLGGTRGETDGSFMPPTMRVISSVLVMMLSQELPMIVDSSWFYIILISR